MEIYPAIDLRRGECVRLTQGDFDQETVYARDPMAVAHEFQAAGSRWLHIVDLDAAKDPTQSQWSLINKIVDSVDLDIQIGGGVRNEKQIQRLLNDGCQRVIIGSMAANEPDTVTSW